MILDVVVGFILVLSMVLGFRSGFVWSFLHMAGWLLSVVVAFAFAPKLSAFLLEKTSFYEAIHSTLSERFADAVNIDRVAHALPSILKDMTESLAKETSDAASASVADLLFAT
ncbi:MAG: CvpA family protein, partial [Clostridiales bacterium]|nr:CvpA family protein [Clostridiales bacterium]